DFANRVVRALFPPGACGEVNGCDVVTPTYQHAAVWILMFNGVHWPVGGTGGQAIPAPQGGHGSHGSHQRSPGLEDVFVIFSPSGECLDTMVLPAA
ncbi:MAG: hypothetical protein ACYCVS_01335, partial [Acidimicrobiales bacterium]